MKPFPIPVLILLLSSVLLCFAEEKPRYIWDTELEQLTPQQRSFVEEIVTAFRTSNIELGKSRLHSDVLKNSACANRFAKIFEMSTVKEQYAVQIKPSDAPNALHVSIRHQHTGEDHQRDFLHMSKVVEENGKLVIVVDSCIKK